MSEAITKTGGNQVLGGPLEPNGNFIGWSKGTDIADGATPTIPLDGNYFDFGAGGTTVTSFVVNKERIFIIQFDAINILIHHATTLDLPSEANITTAAGDSCFCYATADNKVHVFSYTRADGTPVVGGGGGSVTASSTDTFTNKTIDANGTGNVLTNIDIGNSSPASQAEAEAGTNNVKLVTPLRVAEAIAALGTINSGEVQIALNAAYLQFNSINTVDIVFPHIFTDGSTWATISAFSTVTTGKTNGNTFWLGMYYDGSATYTKSTAPVSGNISFVWSASSSTEPARPANGIKIGTYLKGVGDGSSANADILNFRQDGNQYLTYGRSPANLVGSIITTIVNTDASAHVPPNALYVIMALDIRTALTTNNGVDLNTTYYYPNTVISFSFFWLICQITSNSVWYKDPWMMLPMDSTQVITNKGIGIQNAHNMGQLGWVER